MKRPNRLLLASSFLIVLGFLAAFAGFCGKPAKLYHIDDPTETYSYQESDRTDGKGEKPVSWWPPPPPNDATSFYTFLLALGTFGLAGFSLWQITFLTRAEKIASDTAKAATMTAENMGKSAEAAARHVDSVVRIELPIFFIESISMERVEKRVMVTMGNYGKTPCVVTKDAICFLKEMPDTLIPIYPDNFEHQARLGSVIEYGNKYHIIGFFDDIAYLDFNGGYINDRVFVFGYIDYIDFMKEEEEKVFASSEYLVTININGLLAAQDAIPTLVK